MIFLAQAALAAMQTDGKEGLCIAPRTIGFVKKSFFRMGIWNKRLVLSLSEM